MRRRLVLVALATTSMVVIAFLVPLALLVGTLAEERALRSAEVAAQSLAPALALEDDLTVVEEFVEGAQSRIDGTLTVFLPDGSTLGVPTPVDGHVLAARTGAAFSAEEPTGKEIYVPVFLSDADDAAVVRAFVPNEVLRRGVTTAWIGLAALGIVLVGGAALVADRLGRSTVQSVRELEAVANRLADGDLDARVSADDPEEVARVADALNLLAGRIVELLADEREAAADLSHRLRTPLTALRLEAEVLPEGDAAGRIRTSVDDLERAVDRVIRDARRPVREGVGASTDLVAVVHDRVEYWAALADEQGRDWELDLDVDHAPVPVLPDDAEAAVDALLSNVFAHTGEDVTFRVRLHRPADDAVELTVEDTGPGIEPAALQRGVSGRASTGLGLDIVRRTAELTGGRMTVGRSELGGASVHVRFGSSRPSATAG